MMSEYYDPYHRWEPLAEFHFNVDGVEELYDDEDSYIYCLCSRAFIRDSVKTYYTQKDDASESDIEPLHEIKTSEFDDQSHVHFSVDVFHKVKCEKDEGASCYYSASHTENYCSTDEHDPIQNQGTVSNTLQPSDSGADLTYPDCQSDYLLHENVTEFSENYLSEETFEKFWALHGERLIWASWIKNYSDYINPAFLDENNELAMGENHVPKQHPNDVDLNNDQPEEKCIDEKECMRERKYSYDSKVNPYKNKTAQSSAENNISESLCNKDDAWVPIGRRRSCSEHDRMLSPRTLAATDSMTNVTKITLSSYDVSSSHVTSESSPTDDYSVSSSTSDDHTHDQTKIVNIDDSLDQTPFEEVDTEQYWQFLWKKHFGEQYAFHYASYVENHTQHSKLPDIPEINVEMVSKNEIDEPCDIECENSEGNSQETPTVIELNKQQAFSIVVDVQAQEVNTQQAVPTVEGVQDQEVNTQKVVPTVIEVQAQINKIKIDEKPKKESKSSRYIDSVGILLQSLLKEEQNKSEMNEVAETGEKNKNNKNTQDNKSTEESVMKSPNIEYLPCNTNTRLCNDEDGDDDPPEEKSFTLKRSHEIDDAEEASEKIRSTFQIMGFCLRPDKMPKGEIVYRKRLARLRPPRHKRYGVSRKTYFDDDGNPYQAQDSQDEREAQTDDYSEVQSEVRKANPEVSSTDASEMSKSELEVDNKDLESSGESRNVVLEASGVPLPSDQENSFSDTQENENNKKTEFCIGNSDSMPVATKRKRRQKRHYRMDQSLDETEVANMPDELKGDPKMTKYWKKRHSLFHKFDEGVRLDHESWFSVTPENVARHIATKCTYDVVVDGFCGAGGNTIQFARTSKKVIAIDIDPVKIDLAKHNAAVYGVSDYVEFIVGDFFELAPELKADMVFLSPPWGGPNYSKNEVYDLETMLEPRPASELMAVARNISPNITLYLPRNSTTDQILSLAQESSGSVEIEQNYLDRRFVAITAYFY